MVLISDNEVCEASKRGGGAEGTSHETTATEDVWEIVNHLLKSYNQQNKSKNQNPGTSLHDLITNPVEDEVVVVDLPNHEPGKVKKIEQLAHEFGQQTAPSIQCSISEQLQVINEEDLAAILPDVENSTDGSFDEFALLSNRDNDSTSTLIKSLDAPYDDVSLLSKHNQISKETLEAESSPANPPNINVENDADNPASSPSKVVEQISSLHVENSDLINPSIYSWLLKPCETDNLFSNSDTIQPELAEHISADGASRCSRSLRSANKRRQSQTLENNNALNCDGEASIKIDCSVSHISLDSGFGGSPSYTSSPTSAYMYSPLSMDNKSPTSTFRSPGARTFYETNSFKRSQSSPERNIEKIDDSFQGHSQSNNTMNKKGRGRPPKIKNGHSRKKSVPRKSDISSLVEKLISIEERSKKVVKKSPQRERIKKVQRWLKLERKKKSKKNTAENSNISPDIDRLILKFSSFTIVEKNPHLTRASNQITKSKFRCKCCADNYPKRNFSHSKKNRRRKERKTESLKDNLFYEKANQQSTKVEHPSPANKKKIKRNIELSNEKYEQRLPLKKRFYRLPITSHSKIDSFETSADIVEEDECKVSSSNLKVSEECELSSGKSILQLSSDDSGVTRSMPVTPKKRYQMNHSSTSENKRLESALSKNEFSDVSLARQTEASINVIERIASKKTSKFSDEICKKMKSVSLVPSYDLNICYGPSAKDLNKVSKSQRKISSKISKRSKRTLESNNEAYKNESVNFEKIATVVDNDNYGCTTSTEFSPGPSVSDKNDESSVVLATKQTTSDCQSKISSENKDYAKDKKKRRRTFNRTGFPTKKKKKKHNTAVSDFNESASLTKEKLVVNEIKSGIDFDELCFKGMSNLDLSDRVARTNLNYVPESLEKNSHYLLNSEDRLVKSTPVDVNSVEENLESTKFHSKVVDKKNIQLADSDKDMDTYQRRKVTLRGRARHKNYNSLSVESEEKGCDNISKIRKICLDNREYIDRSESIISEKQYLNAGLFSNQFKISDSGNVNEDCHKRYSPEHNIYGLLPPPLYYAKWVRQRKIDFTLPFDIWLSHKKSKTFSAIDESNQNEVQKPLLPIETNGCCDYNFGSSGSSTTDLSFDSVEPTCDCDLSFSSFYRHKCSALLNFNVEPSLHGSEPLTDEQTRYIRKNSCFLIRNLMKARKMLALKKQRDSKSLQNTDSTSNLKLNCNEKIDKFLPSLKSFQDSTSSSAGEINIQTDCLFDSKGNRKITNTTKQDSLSESNVESKCHLCFSQSPDSLSSCCKNCCKKRCCDRKPISMNVNKSSCRQNLQSSAMEIPVETVPAQAENGQKYFKLLINGNIKIQTGENVYVTKNRIEFEQDAVAESSSFGKKDCDVFHIKRLWRDKNNDGYAFGHYYLRPHETFHEPSRKFFHNELMKSPLCETISISRIVDHCHVLDLNSYCKGRPVGASIEHVFICEYRVDKAAKTFSRIPKRKARFCSDIALELHKSPIKPVRDFKPYSTTNNFKSRKKQSKNLEPSLETEAGKIVNTCGLIQNTSLIQFSTEIEPAKTNQMQRLNSIICKLSEKVNSAYY